MFCLKRHLDPPARAERVLQRIGGAHVVEALLHEYHELRQASGGVLLLRGSDMQTIDAALRQMCPVSRHLHIIATSPSGPHAQDIQRAIKVAQSGAVAVVNAGYPDSKGAHVLQRSGVRCAAVFVYASPREIATRALAAGNAPEAVDALERFYHFVGGSGHKANGTLGSLRRQHVQRLMASIRRAMPTGSPLLQRCDTVEQNLYTALGLSSRPKVYLHTRQPCDAAVSLVQLGTLPLQAASLLSGSHLGLSLPNTTNVQGEAALSSTGITDDLHVTAASSQCKATPHQSTAASPDAVQALDDLRAVLANSNATEAKTGMENRALAPELAHSATASKVPPLAHG